MQYFKATKMLSIIFGKKEKDDLIIKSYFNLDLAGKNVTKKSILKFVFMLNERLVG